MRFFILVQRVAADGQPFIHGTLECSGWGFFPTQLKIETAFFLEIIKYVIQRLNADMGRSQLWICRKIDWKMSQATILSRRRSGKVRLNALFRGMRHTSTALYFYGASKKSLQKPRAIYGNILFHISYGFNYYLQLLCMQFLSKTRLNFTKFTFCIKMACFLKSSLFQSRIDKIAHLQNKTFTYQLYINFFLDT